MAQQACADMIERQVCERKRAVAVTYVSGTVQHVVELVSKVPITPSILGKLDGKERRPLWPRPRVPVSLVRVVVYESGVAAFLPLDVILGNFGQVAVFVDVSRENEYASLGRIAKGGWRRSWEFANQHGRIRSSAQGRIGEMDQDGIDARGLAFLVSNNMTDGAVIEPERLSTVR